MDATTIALFGEAERGEYHTAYFCTSLQQLSDYLGNPPDHSRGLDYAVQALHYHHNLIFFRVREEGFSSQDYFHGVHLLKSQTLPNSLAAICIPGVGSNEIIDAMCGLCIIYHSLLITTASDLYDYLTQHAA